MRRYDQDRLELSTRDRVAPANYKEIQEGRGGAHGRVFLDISHQDKRIIIEKLPRMYRQFMESQLLDISIDKMEAAPTEHYPMGGVLVDPETHKSDIDGLYAAGEVTSGVHGVKRLGSTSLNKVLVFGRRAGHSAAECSTKLDAQIRIQSLIQEAHLELDDLIKPGEELACPLQRALRNNLWENCGDVRDRFSLLKDFENLEEIKESSNLVDVRPGAEGFRDLAVAFDLRGSIIVAEATIHSAVAERKVVMLTSEKISQSLLKN